MTERLTHAGVLACLGVVLTVMVSACGATNASNQPAAAATVNGRPISLSSYHYEVAYKRQVAADSTGGVDVCALRLDKALCQQLKRTALNDLIGSELVRQYAAKHHIAVTQSDFNRQWTLTKVDQFHDNTAVMRAYLKRFGITVPVLKQFVRDDILQRKVMAVVTRSMSIYSPGVALARIMVSNEQQLKTVQKALKSGKSFGQVAQTLAADDTTLCGQDGCGNMGWLPNALVPRSEKAVLTARAGTIIGPISTQQAILLLLVETHSPRIRMTSQQQIALRDQLFARWLKRLEQHANIRRYVAT